MGNNIVVTGMVLQVMPIGEYDKRITLLTKERGKITAFARGARRPNSQLLAAANPFCFGEFELFEGRSAYTLARATIQNYFRELTGDFDATYYGFYFMEFAEYYTREQNDETQMLKLLYQTFRALTKKNISNELIRCIYELKAVYINGEGPQVFQCVKCGSADAPVVFSVRQGGIICKNCINEVKDAVEIDTSTLYAMQYIAGSSIEKLYTFTVSENVLKKLKKIVSGYLSFYVDKTFKSLEILEICLK